LYCLQCVNQGDWFSILACYGLLFKILLSGYASGHIYLLHFVSGRHTFIGSCEGC